MIYVTVYFNTEADGAPVDESKSFNDSDYPRCIFGPFESMDAAEYSQYVR